MTENQKNYLELQCMTPEARRKVRRKKSMNFIGYIYEAKNIKTGYFKRGKTGAIHDRIYQIGMEENWNIEDIQINILKVVNGTNEKLNIEEIKAIKPVLGSRKCINVSSGGGGRYSSYTSVASLLL